PSPHPDARGGGSGLPADSRRSTANRSPRQPARYLPSARLADGRSAPGETPRSWRVPRGERTTRRPIAVGAMTAELLAEDIGFAGVSTSELSVEHGRRVDAALNAG